MLRTTERRDVSGMRTRRRGLRAGPDGGPLPGPGPVTGPRVRPARTSRLRALVDRSTYTRRNIGARLRRAVCRRKVLR